MELPRCLGDNCRMVTASLPMLYVNTYAPLVATAVGRENARRQGIRPFVDGSIRREPDLEHACPSISCLCRGGRFAPRLRVGDVVVYMTKKSRYGQKEACRYLTAMLKVVHCFKSHSDAACWYRGQGLDLPSNCMVPGNGPKPLDASHGNHPDDNGCTGRSVCNHWDAGYRKRAEQHPCFLVCNALWCDLEWSAPKLSDSDLFAVFGEVPHTRNPGAMDMAYLRELVRHCRLVLHES